jgi:hypothetical protein
MDKVKAIPVESFIYCSSLQSISFKLVEDIRERAFNSCNLLSLCYLPNLIKAEYCIESSKPITFVPDLSDELK